MSQPEAFEQERRRTQAERTAATRRRILRAVVESIDAVGFQKTTASEITRRAGVTWGAVQHHFGGKDGILRAALEESFERFAAQLADVGRDAPLAERVSRFVDRAWAHFGSPSYRSTFEILLNHTREDQADARDDDPIWRSQMWLAWNEMWAEIFSDVHLTRRETVTLQTFTIATLSGMASLGMLGRAVESIRDAELEILKHTLLREMGG